MPGQATTDHLPKVRRVLLVSDLEVAALGATKAPSWTTAP